MELSSIDYQILEIANRVEKVHKDDIIAAFPGLEEIVEHRLIILSKMERMATRDPRQLGHFMPSSCYVFALRDKNKTSSGFYAITTKGKYALREYALQNKERKMSQLILVFSGISAITGILAVLMSIAGLLPTK